MQSKRGQVTIFIIIAVVIVLAALAYIFIRANSSSSPQVPASLQPVYNTFLSCLQQDTSTGVSVLESQGGYIYLPPFQPGSGYMPFGSQLNFLGNPVPYWYYVSGNNIPETQVPSLNDMQNQLAQFVDQKISDCRFNDYYSQGFNISLGSPTATVSISNNNVQVNLNADLSIAGKNASTVISSHQVTVNSELGTLYNSAVNVYNEEQSNMFLEQYGIDTLRSYAPVDGVDITCAPETWNANDVFTTLKQAIEENTNAMTNNGNKTYYFNPKLSVSQDVRFLNSQNWPSSYEVSPTTGTSPIMSASPVGNQQGLGIIGFCYVPYHFVYSVKYPVMVQVLSSENANEIFQFPVAVVIENNNPREPLNGTAVENTESTFCQYKNTQVQVNVENSQGNPVAANVSYECAGSTCDIGQASAAGILQDNFPQCYNGYVIASAPGYKDAKYLLSTVSNGSVNVIMDPLYTENIQLELDGVNYNGDAMITFTSGDSAATISYPTQKSVQLSTGQYNVQAYIFKNTSITLGARTTQQCTTVPQSGVLGALGLTHQQCFNVQIPQQVVSNVIAGGGNQSYYFLDSDLRKTNSITINVKSLPVPTTADELQNNYLLADSNGLDITL